MKMNKQKQMLSKVSKRIRELEESSKMEDFFTEHMRKIINGETISVEDDMLHTCLIIRKGFFADSSLTKGEENGKDN